MSIMKKTALNAMIGLMLVLGLTIFSTDAMAQRRGGSALRPSPASTGKHNVSTPSPRNNNSSSRPTSERSIFNKDNKRDKAPNTNDGKNKPPKNNVTNRESKPNVVEVKDRDRNPRVNEGRDRKINFNEDRNRDRKNNFNEDRNRDRRPLFNEEKDRGPKQVKTERKRTVQKRENKGFNPPPGHQSRPRIGGTVMHGDGHKDYSQYRYNKNKKRIKEVRPRYRDDRFYNHYRHNSWSWSNPIRPSVRRYRPATIWVYRPTLEVNVVQRTNYPNIAGVLDLSWGTPFNDALNYLYLNEYNIDGYENNIVYLTDVVFLDYIWEDVMLHFDDNGNFDYVEFASSSATDYDNSKFSSIHELLFNTYGSPVLEENSTYSWYGGDGIGFVNLGQQEGEGVYYTILTFGV